MKRALKRLLQSFFIAAALASASEMVAQSSDQNYPTPVTASEIRGTIRARDIGDSRLTTHFYAFDGSQGDIFINIQTRNFDGDIDVFTADGLRPLTKIVLYSDAGVSETGRIVYLRKGERLLLRVEGRSPDDSPAAYTIKFAGSFVALESNSGSPATGVPKVSGDDPDGVRLNSIGAVTQSRAVKKPPIVAITPAKESTAKSEPPPPAKPAAKPAASTASRPLPAKENPASPPVKTSRQKPPPSPTVVVSDPVVPDPLASIRLTIQLKNGGSYERPMSDVLRFSTDKGVITVIGKDGKIVRYLLTDVAKVTIQ